MANTKKFTEKTGVEVRVDQEGWEALKAYENNPLWKSDPKIIHYRDSMKIMLPNGYPGPMGYASAACMADFIMVNMVAEAVSGSKTPKEALDRAKARAERYYKV